MSTKNLARTVIEGGRTSGSCWNRRYSDRVHRQLQRGLVSQWAQGPGLDDLVVPAQRRAFRAFDDKLSPAKRWLQRQVGRPWNRVRAELLATFDTRTTAGRHIVFDHMLLWVENDHGFGRWANFTVDRHGLLRWRNLEWPGFPRKPEALPLPQAKLELWLAGRRVGGVGEVLFWYVPTCRGAYRQHHRLSLQDAQLWRSLPRWYRERNLPEAAPAEPSKSP